MEMSLADPKGLVRESYAIEGIKASECRSIFLDWALSLKPGVETVEAIRVLLSHYGPDWPDHPMTAVLTSGLTAPAAPARRGGRAARMQHLDGN
ncbi:MAG: hypothetical protein WBB85_14040 [Albidovulum sp.]|uniref:hypothetical protein n=1 Tax=Albidovulum sp. TaxID=1872424 RepID=UPI003C952A0F